MNSYQTIRLEMSAHIATVFFNRPEKANALNQDAWKELADVFAKLDQEENTRVIILTGVGKHFCSGIDLSLLQSITQANISCTARQSEAIRKQIMILQAAVSAIENCNKPVLAAISGGCIGAGVDIVSACDMRYASDNAFFCVKEIDMGMVADLGTLQRLPRIIAQGIARELAYTGRNVWAEEAEKIGLINKMYSTSEILLKEVTQIAQQIADKSPISIRGTKHILKYSQDHSVADGLNYIATWNAAMLVSEDLKESFQALQEKRNPQYKN